MTSTTLHPFGWPTVTDAFATPKTTDIAIIGGGIVGLSCAHALAQRGLDVTIVEARGPGAETSYGNAGSISIGNVLPQSTPGIMKKGVAMLFDPDAPLRMDAGAWANWLEWLLRFVWAGGASRVMPVIDAMHAINTASRDAWLQLAADIGAPELVADTGYLHVYGETQTFEKGQWERDLMAERKVSFKVLDSRELRELEPNIGEGFKHAVFQDESLAMLDPGGFCLRLADALKARKVGWFDGTVGEIGKLPGGGYKLVTDHGSVNAKRVVVAAGVWSRRLLKPLGADFCMIPARGYHLMYPNQENVARRPTLWAERYMVVSPMVPGIRMTSIKELTAIGRDPKYSMIHRRDEDAHKLFPKLGAATGQWFGYRPCTPDSLPVIDRAPHEDIFIAAGHGHLGLTQAPITGQLIGQLMAGEATSIPVQPYRLGRF